jgi:gamma-tubulin complex component 3
MLPKPLYEFQVGFWVYPTALATDVKSELEPEWHKIRLITAEMIHFIRQMSAYCHLEVIECSWTALMDFINEKEGDLDALIGTHRVYLDRMVKKLLLIGSKAGREVDHPSASSTDQLLAYCYSFQESLLNQVKEAFSLMLRFYDATVSSEPMCVWRLRDQ